MAEISGTHPASEADAGAAVRRIALFYAFVPLVGGILWFIFGTPGELRNRSPIELLIFVELAIILAAYRSGFGQLKFKGIRWTPVTVLLAVFAASWVFGIAFAAENPAAGLERSLYRLIHVITALAMLHLLNTARIADLQVLLASLVAQPLLHLPVVVTLYLLYADTNLINWRGGPVGYWHVRIWGMGLAVAIAATVGLYASADRTRPRDHALALVVLTLLSAMLFWSGTRAGVAALVLTIGFAGILFPRRVLATLPVVLVAAVIGAALSLTVPVPSVEYGILNSIEETAAASVDAASGSRLTLWRDTVAMIADRPIIGHGHDQFVFNVTGEFERFLQPHNFVLNLLFDFGIVGGTALAALLLIAWWRGLLRVQQSNPPHALGALMALNALVVMGMVDGALYHKEGLVPVAFCLAMLLARPRDVASPRSPGYIAPQQEQR